MKDTFRQSMKWFHTWVGLVVGWILFFMFITGTTGYFYEEINRWMEPERPLVNHVLTTEEVLDRAQDYLEVNATHSHEWDIYLPSRRDYNVSVGWREAPKAGETRGDYVTKVLDLDTGETVDTRDTGGGRLLYRMHYRLHYLSTDISYWIVGFCSMLMLLAVITGVVLHKKIFIDFFTFRAKKGLTGWLDIHNVLSVISLPYHFMITYSGLLFFFGTYMVLSVNLQMTDQQLDDLYDEIYPRAVEVVPANVPAKMQRLSVLHQKTKQFWPQDTLEQIEIYGANDINANVRFYRGVTDITYNPADEIVFNGITGEMINETNLNYTVPGMIENGLFSLHEGQFADSLTRLAYLLTGLIGTAMIASGLVLWTTKRRPQQMKKTSGPDFGYRLVEQLNIGTIAGLPIAIAMYFYANRLLPIEMVGRAEWEAHIMFISWALLLIYPAFRPKAKAWIEQLNLAAVVFIFLPILNAMTTQKHLAITIAHGDWHYAGFDLTMLVIGCAFAFAAFKVKQLQQKTKSASKPKSITTQANKAKEPELVLNKDNTGAC